MFPRLVYLFIPFASALFLFATSLSSATHNKSSSVAWSSADTSPAELDLTSSRAGRSADWSSYDGLSIDYSLQWEGKRPSPSLVVLIKDGQAGEDKPMTFSLPAKESVKDMFIPFSAFKIDEDWLLAHESYTYKADWSKVIALRLICSIRDCPSGKLSVEKVERSEEPDTITAIVPEGLVKTRDFVVRRELLFREGERLDGETRKRIQLSVDELKATGLFESVVSEEERIAKSNRYIVRLKFEEKETGYFESYPLFSDYYQRAWLGGFACGDNNLFGRGLRASGTGNWGEYGAFHHSFKLADPYFLSQPLYFSAQAERKFEPRDAYDVEKKDLAFTLGAADKSASGIYVQVSREEGSLIRLNHDKVELSQLAQEPYPRGHKIAYILHISEGSDFLFAPGWNLRYSYTSCGGRLGGDLSFRRHDYRLRIGDKKGRTIWHFKCSYVPHDNLNEMNLPVYERPMSGGTDSVRGYRQGELSQRNESGIPLGAQFAMAYGITSYHSLPGEREVGWYLFYDRGATSDKIKQMKFSEQQDAWGVGLCLKKFRFEWARSLSGGNQDRKGRFHFSHQVSYSLEP